MHVGIGKRACREHFLPAGVVGEKRVGGRCGGHCGGVSRRDVAVGDAVGIAVGVAVGIAGGAHEERILLSTFGGERERMG